MGLSWYTPHYKETRVQIFCVRVNLHVTHFKSDKHWAGMFWSVVIPKGQPLTEALKSSDYRLLNAHDNWRCFVEEEPLGTP